LFEPVALAYRIQLVSHELTLAARPVRRLLRIQGSMRSVVALPFQPSDDGVAVGNAWCHDGRHLRVHTSTAANRHERDQRLASQPQCPADRSV
jgi:hypothetical protein